MFAGFPTKFPGIPFISLEFRPILLESLSELRGSVPNEVFNIILNTHRTHTEKITKRRSGHFARFPGDSPGITRDFPGFPASFPHSSFPDFQDVRAIFLDFRTILLDFRTISPDFLPFPQVSGHFPGFPGCFLGLPQIETYRDRSRQTEK